MKVGSLFAGIGGFDLGLERAGFEIAWQVEIDPYCQRVLAKHWPAVTRYGDIREVDWHTVEPVDLLCGGFPCQDISLAGKGAGLTGERSGLWFEYAKAIEVLKPRYVLIENVSALRSRGLDQVLGALASLGYEAEWHCIPACAVGAPHRRDRVWVVAYRSIDGLQKRQRENGQPIGGSGEPRRLDIARSRPHVADAYRTWELQSQGGEQDQRGRVSDGCRWEPEPELGRVAHGVPHRVDRLRGLGNAIVPQIAEWIGRQIMKANPTKGARDE